MISQYTWPNFPTGDAEEGTKMLLEDRKLVKDVTFGKTKIFVRTPATLFELERARSDFKLLYNFNYKAQLLNIKKNQLVLL